MQTKPAPSNKHIELLAPARDLICGKTAVNYGADAVYMGAARFGAREKAGNSIRDIAALIAYAHKYWARVYVTLNTILNDSEIPPALILAKQLQEAGVDGLIIQDMGLLAGLQAESWFTLPLIASTQTHNHTKEKVAFLESAGFKRAILARELSLDEIRTIRSFTTAIELEAFVYGALCVSYSGQCYLSYSLGGRSGNRGECAQPCRKLYDLVDKTGRVLVTKRHLLSLCDLNAGEYLKELIQAGISSLKIEGRLKDQYYVGNAVAYFRQKLDRILPELSLAPSSSGHTLPDFTPEPAKTFNRGFTTYFLSGRSHPVGSFATPKMQGELIGKVTRVKGNALQIETTKALCPGDGLTFFNSEGVLCGSAVNAVTGSVIVLNNPGGCTVGNTNGITNRVTPGMLLYRNYDHGFMTRLKRAIDREACTRKIAVAWLWQVEPDQLLVTVQDEDGNTATCHLALPAERAKNREKMHETIRTQMQKTGDTEYSSGNVEIDPAFDFFLTVAALNAIRRQVLEELAQVRLLHYPPAFGAAGDTDTGRVDSASSGSRPDCPYPATRLNYTGNVFNRQAQAFYRKHGVTETEPAAESGIMLAGKQVMTCRMCIRHELGWCRQSGGEAGGAGQPGCQEALYLVDEAGRKLRLVFDCRRCVMEVYLSES